MEVKGAHGDIPSLEIYPGTAPCLRQSVAVDNANCSMFFFHGTQGAHIQGLPIWLFHLLVPAQDDLGMSHASTATMS